MRNSVTANLPTVDEVQPKAKSKQSIFDLDSESENSEPENNKSFIADIIDAEATEERQLKAQWDALYSENNEHRDDIAHNNGIIRSLKQDDSYSARKKPDPRIAELESENARKEVKIAKNNAAMETIANRLAGIRVPREGYEEMRGAYRGRNILANPIEPAAKFDEAKFRSLGKAIGQLKKNRERAKGSRVEENTAHARIDSWVDSFKPALKILISDFSERKYNGVSDEAVSIGNLAVLMPGVREMLHDRVTADYKRHGHGLGKSDVKATVTSLNKDILRLSREEESLYLAARRENLPVARRRGASPRAVFQFDWAK